MGLYSGISDDFKYNVFYLFATNGRVFKGKPRWRADRSFDFEASEADKPSALGSHRIEQNEIVFSWPDGKENRYPTFRTSVGQLAFKTMSESQEHFEPTAPNTTTQLSGT